MRHGPTPACANSPRVPRKHIQFRTGWRHSGPITTVCSRVWHMRAPQLLPRLVSSGLAFPDFVPSCSKATGFGTRWRHLGQVWPKFPNVVQQPPHVVNFWPPT